MGVLFANRVKTTLSAAATAAATTLALSNVANLPAIGGGNYCYLTLTSPDQTAIEVVKATAIVGNSVTVTRAQEGTAAVAWAQGTPVELRLTTGALLDALADRLGLHAAADAALKLATARNIAATGDIAWSVNFDGSGDATSAATVQAHAITTAKLAAMGAAGLKGVTVAGDVADLDVATVRTMLAISNVENKSSAVIRAEITSANVTTALGFTPEQAGVAMPKTGGTFSGLVTANGGIDGGTSEIKSRTITVNSGAGQLRVMPRDGGTSFPYLYSPSNSTLVFQVNGVGEAARLDMATGFDVGSKSLKGQYVSVSGTDCRIDINSRNGGANAALYNTDSSLRIFFGADKFVFASDGKWTFSGSGTVTGNITANGDIYANRGDGTGVIFFGAAGSSTKYLYWDNTRYTMPGAELSVNGGYVLRHLDGSRARGGVSIVTAAPAAGAGQNGDIWLVV